MRGNPRGDGCAGAAVSPASSGVSCTKSKKGREARPASATVSPRPPAPSACCGRECVGSWVCGWGPGVWDAPLRGLTDQALRAQLVCSPRAGSRAHAAAQGAPPRGVGASVEPRRNAASPQLHAEGPGTPREAPGGTGRSRRLAPSQPPHVAQRRGRRRLGGPVNERV